MERQAQQAVREDRGLEKERQPERAAAAQQQVQSAARAAAVLRMGGAAVRLRAEDVLNLEARIGNSALDALLAPKPGLCMDSFAWEAREAELPAYPLQAERPALFQSAPRVFRYQVEIDGISRAGFSEVSGMSSSVDSIEYREGDDLRNTPRKLPGLTKFGNVTLRWGVSDDTDFLAWVYSVAPTNTANFTAQSRVRRRSQCTILR